MTDRTEAARCMAKVIAYQAVGNDQAAANWLKALLYSLGYPEVAKTI